MGFIAGKIALACLTVASLRMASKISVAISTRRELKIKGGYLYAALIF
jgi:hypothetical protein